MINTDDNGKKCNALKKWVSSISFALTIVCVVGFIVYKFHSKQKTAPTITFDKSDITFDLSVMSSNVMIKNCADADDISPDGEYGKYTYAEDIQSITDDIINNWFEFAVNVIKPSMKTNHDHHAFLSCFKKETYSGKITCEETCSTTVTHKSKDDNTITFCKDLSFDLLTNEIRPNRRACIIKEITSQLGNICQVQSVSQSVSRSIASNAFKWYKNKYDVSSQWAVTDCP